MALQRQHRIYSVVLIDYLLVLHGSIKVLSLGRGRECLRVEILKGCYTFLINDYFGPFIYCITLITVNQNLGRWTMRGNRLRSVVGMWSSFSRREPSIVGHFRLANAQSSDQLQDVKGLRYHRTALNPFLSRVKCTIALAEASLYK